MIKFLYLLLRISQSYQSVSHHLLPHPQHTPKTVQQQQGQQEQLKIKTGFSCESHGEVFIYNNSYQQRFGPFSDINYFYIYN
jgi:hypothetical protein